MTREEAIYRLKNTAWLGTNADREETEQAVDMAIEALQNEPTPCEKCIHVKSCRKVIILKNLTYKLVKYCSQGAERKEP